MEGEVGMVAPGRGRPRDPALDERILEQVVALVHEEGQVHGDGTVT